LSQQVVFVSGTILPQGDIAGYVVAAMSGVMKSWGPPGYVKPKEGKPEFYLEALPDIELRDLCRVLYEELSRTVVEAESRFWR